jgi:PIN domain nuclease of toxin-antitoxin system
MSGQSEDCSSECMLSVISAFELAANVMKKSGAPHLAKIDDAALQQLP